ncbi:hypothetical protein ACFLUT_01120 [Chloroflexota bacterium]
MRYVHIPDGSDEHDGHGVWASWEECRIRYDGRDVLYLMTDAVVDTVCCGDRVFHYATVLGYVAAWKAETNEAGLPVSHVELIDDGNAQDQIVALLKAQDPGVQVSFRSD